MAESKVRNLSWANPIPEDEAICRKFNPAYFEGFCDKLSKVGMFELGFHPAGTTAGHQAGELIEREMRRIGLETRREPFPVYAWGFKGARIEICGMNLRNIMACSFPPTPGTGRAGLKAFLVDLGMGTASDYLNRSVRGKVAFVRLDVNVMSHWGIIAYEAELHGAIGVVFYYVNGYAQHSSGEALNIHDGMCRDTIPLLQISIKDGNFLSELLAAKDELEITIFSNVEADPEGVGYNVVGAIPGRRYLDRYLFMGAHYDAWFNGYWDNASGVAGMLATAKALIDSGYQPDHTLVFIATDAEEFGAPDSIFDWLIGIQRFLETHPEYIGKTRCCFNFDTLCLKWAKHLSFYGNAEMVRFIRSAAAGWDLRSGGFDESRAVMDNYITPWTETYSWASFGVPVVQPMFDQGEIKQTHYHTQFDTREIFDFEKSIEAIRLCGSLFVRLDRIAVPPYDFLSRAEALRASVDWNQAEKSGLTNEIAASLDRFESRARKFALEVDRVNEIKWSDTLSSVEPGRIDCINQQILEAVRYILVNCSHLGGNLSHEVMYSHESTQKSLSTLNKAIMALGRGEGQTALEIITEKEGGLTGAFFGLHASYLTYYHYTVGAVNPKRPNLFWGRNRTQAYVDCWAVIQILKDKVVRRLTDYEEELYTLERFRDDLLERLQEEFRKISEIADTTSHMLPIEELKAI